MSKIIYTILLLCLCTLTPLHAANDVATANDAYCAGDYHKAIALYHQALKKGMSAEAYYNLGNAYYRTDNLPKALLYYEKAQKLAPLNKDIQHNIDIARAKTIDKMPADSDIFFIQWYRGLQSIMTVDQWAATATASLVTALILFLAYLFMNNMLIRRCSFYAFTILLVICILSNLLAYQRKSSLNSHDAAIVMGNTVQVKVSPTLKSNDACIIHEGTKVTITDHDMSQWLGIRLADGREGWIQSKDIEEI